MTNVDNQAALAEFYREEAARRLSSESTRSSNTSKKERMGIEKADSKKTFTCVEAEHYALTNGLDVTVGNGFHGKHIVDPVSGHEISLPDHPGNMSKKVSTKIRKFIKKFGHQPPSKK